MKLLLVDDEPLFLKSLKRILEDKGYDVLMATDSKKALEILETQEVKVMLTDLRMPKPDGLDLLEMVKSNNPFLEVIMISAFGTLANVKTALEKGAFDFLVKPFSSKQQLVEVVAKAVNRALLRERGSDHSEKRNSQPEIVGISDAIEKIRRLIDQVAETNASVLIQGESGSGKELVARTIHLKSQRRYNPFIPVNCSTVENLLEAELFGYERGAFTGAFGRHIGIFEAANTGTIFLDEIGDLSIHSQVKLLRVLQEGEIRRVGSNKPIKVDVRVISATNHNLEELVEISRFRRDLFYRLNVIKIELPPLRERPSDIPVLAEYFLSRFAKEMNKKIIGFERRALEALISFHWPGNVRELENVIKRAAVFSKQDKVHLSELPQDIVALYLAKEKDEVVCYLPSNELCYKHAKKRALEKFHQEYFEKLLKLTDGNISRAARISHLDRSNLRRLLKKYKFEPNQNKKV